MNVDSIDVQLVAREPDEAQDLGLQLLRRHAGATFGAVLIVIAPVWALALFVGSASTFGGVLAIWWAKPLMNRVAIHVLSRAVFGATPTVLQTVAAVPSMIDRHLLALLTWRRLDFRRSLWFPTAVLEGLRGKDLKERYAAIKYGPVERQASVSTFVFLHIEMALATAGFILAVWMLPEGWLPDFWRVLLGEESPATSRFQWVSIVSWLPGLLICEVAYTAAGFGMYVSRRTELEGWNIELAFQRLGSRLAAAARRGVAILIPLLIAAVALIGPAHAQDAGGEPVPAEDQSAADQSDAELGDAALTEPGDIARDVLSQPDFSTTKETTTWVPNFDMGGDSEGGSALMGFVATILKGLGWIAVASVIIGLIVYLARRAETVRVLAAVQQAPKPVEAFGLDLREESLPSDIVAAAKELARQDAIVPCLSLLYRGALHRLVESEELEIFPGDTEHDCMRRVAEAAKARGSAAAASQTAGAGARRADYFGSLTGRWLNAAWGASPPGSDDAIGLCDGWAVHFQGRPQASGRGAAGRAAGEAVREES